MQKAEEKVSQYSINIQYISKGKSGDALRNQIQKEIDKEKKQLSEYRKSIKSLNEILKNPPKEELEEKQEEVSQEVVKVEAKENVTEENASETPEVENTTESDDVVESNEEETPDNTEDEGEVEETETKD